MAQASKINCYITLKQSLLFPLLLLSLALPHFPASYANKMDRAALLAIKHQIIDDPFEVLTSWNSSVHHCSWEGITCTSRHPRRVIGLELGKRKLRGTLSPNIANLTFLTFISLDENNFYGTIPREVGQLVHLEELSLSNNSFSGEIPRNLTSCSKLWLVNLVDNKLTGNIFPEISLLSNIEGLGLAQNHFTGNIPASLGNLSFLVQISLTGNNLNGVIPVEVCLLPWLTTFLLSDNNITGMVPFCFYNNSEIEFLAVEGNLLEGDLPSHFGLYLPKLRQIYLGSNKFTGDFPVSFSNASNLEIFDFHENFFTGSPLKNLGSLRNLTDINFDKNQLGMSTKGESDLEFLDSLINCTNLRTIDFEHNFLKGPFPESISNLSIKLTGLNAFGNQIHGNVPDGIRNLINMERISLGGNSLTGNIPISLGHLPKLVRLNLQENLFSGSIPISIGNLTKLTDLILGGNHLSGIIPRSLEKCHSLQVLNLSHNNLIGAIPRIIIGSSSPINALYLQHNSFAGLFSLEPGSLSAVVTLDISQNKLSGPIPESLGYCLSLENLYLDRNLFEGEIPLPMKGLRGLKNIDLSHNKLSGEIPEFFESFPLSKLNLSFNELQGEVPNKGIFENVNGVSVIGNKNLCGGIMQLKLPPCVRRTRKKSSFSAKVVIWVIVGTIVFIGLSCLIVVHRRKKVFQRNPQVSTTWFNHVYKVSYAELAKATNDFSAENVVGSGSYGSVYKGNLHAMKKTVAVKVLYLNRQRAFKSFITECNALRNLRHRNLISLLTACSSIDYQGNDFKALVFEFMPNGSLEDWLHPRVDEEFHAPMNLSFIQRLNIAIDVASALEYLHHNFQTQVVHCDIKPSNILLNDNMIAHLSDFGIAKVFSSTPSDALESQINSVAIKGSVGYVAPEYVMAVEVSTQGDVYSYGILLLEMFTRKKPTDDIFVNGLCLHNYVEMALVNNDTGIVDPTMFWKENVEVCENMTADEVQKSLQKCLVSLLRLGVACSVEVAAKRLTMEEAIHELHHIRDYYQCQEVFGDRFTRVTVF